MDIEESVKKWQSQRLLVCERGYAASSKAFNGKEEERLEEDFEGETE